MYVGGRFESPADPACAAARALQDPSLEERSGTRTRKEGIRRAREQWTMVAHEGAGSSADGGDSLTGSG